MFSVYVHKADRLVPESTKGHCDPYVKWCVCVCVWREERERESCITPSYLVMHSYFESASTGSCTKKKTTVCKKTLSPVYNQVSIFMIAIKIPSYIFNKNISHELQFYSTCSRNSSNACSY